MTDFNLEASSQPQVFNQSQLNELIRDLHLPKDASELLAFSLRNKHLVEPGVTTSFACNLGLQILLRNILSALLGISVTILVCIMWEAKWIRHGQASFLSSFESRRSNMLPHKASWFYQKSSHIRLRVGALLRFKFKLVLFTIPAYSLQGSSKKYPRFQHIVSKILACRSRS